MMVQQNSRGLRNNKTLFRNMRIEIVIYETSFRLKAFVLYREDYIGRCDDDDDIFNLNGLQYATLLIFTGVLAHLNF